MKTTFYYSSLIPCDGQFFKMIEEHLQRYIVSEYRLTLLWSLLPILIVLRCLVRFRWIQFTRQETSLGSAGITHNISGHWESFVEQILFPRI